MCTLTLLRERWLEAPDGAGPRWRVVFNRDEQRSRPAAIAPDRHPIGAVRSIHPIDPQGGGTWIAATEYGLVFAILNGDAAAAGEAPGARRSRGGIIPALAARPAGRAADVRTDALDPSAYRPFHLVIADDREVVEIVSDGRAIQRTQPDAGDRVMRTSSSVETAAIRAWRTRLFGPPRTPASAADQDAFHARPEPDRPAYGVAMARADACTVSVTTVEVFAGEMRMAYRSTPGSGEASVTSLARTT